MTATPAVAEIAAAMVGVTEDSLRRRGSLKWTMPPMGTLGASVAEMDLPPARAVTDAVTAAITNGLTGYLAPDLHQRAVLACAAFQQRRFGWTVDPADIHLLPSVFGAVVHTWRYLVPPGTPLILPTPAYMPFLKLPDLFGIEVRTVPMIDDGGRYRMDLDALGTALAGGGLLVLVSPHKPTGRVFDRTELLALSEVVESAGACVLSDEIHSPLVYAPGRHVPYATVSPAAAQHSVTAVSASKGWNVPGLICSQLILNGDRFRSAWAATDPTAAFGSSPLGAIAAAAAYTDGVDHLDRCLGYLAAGVTLFADALAKALPAARFRAPDGTYLGWIDLRDVIDATTVSEVADRCQVAGVDGTDCGAPGFLRLNLATAHELLREMAHRLGRLAPGRDPR